MHQGVHKRIRQRTVYNKEMIFAGQSYPAAKMQKCTTGRAGPEYEKSIKIDISIPAILESQSFLYGTTIAYLSN